MSVFLQVAPPVVSVMVDSRKTHGVMSDCNKQNIYDYRILKTGLQIRVPIFLISKPKHMSWYSKEPSKWDISFEHPKHMFQLMGKKIIAILQNFLLIWTYDYEMVIHQLSVKAHQFSAENAIIWAQNFYRVQKPCSKTGLTVTLSSFTHLQQLPKSIVCLFWFFTS